MRPLCLQMVINVFAVPDAAGLVCVTLGQLEIRDVRSVKAARPAQASPCPLVGPADGAVRVNRMLSCSNLSQVPLCDGLVQAVVGVSRSRVVTLSRSARGSALRVFTLSDSGRYRADRWAGGGASSPTSPLRLSLSPHQLVRLPASGASWRLC